MNRFASLAVLLAVASAGGCSSSSTEASGSGSAGGAGPNETASAPAPVADAALDVAAAPVVDSPITRAPEAMASFGAASLDGRLYTLGGHIGRKHAHSRANQTSAFRTLDDKGAWSDLPGGVALQSVSLVPFDGRLIRIGGVAALNADGEPENMRSTDEVYAFDPVAKSWSPLPSLPTPRSSHDSCELDGRVYVFGGWKLAGGAQGKGEWSDFGFVMDLRQGASSWKPILQPFHRRAVAVAGLRGKIYVIGGLTEQGSPSQTVDVYDVEKAAWAKGPALPGPGFGSSACTLDGRLYATDFDGALSRLSADGNQWETVCHLVFPRFFHRLIPVGGKLAAVCGATKEGHTNSVEWINPLAKGPRVSTIRFPWTGEAKQRQGVFVTGDVLTVFGGNSSADQHKFQPENFSNQVWKVDLRTGEVGRLADLPVRRQSIAPLVVDAPDEGKTWLLGYGGFGFDKDVTVSHAQSFVYDNEKDAWKNLDVPLPVPLTQFGLVVNDRNVWVFGGMDFDPRRGDEKQFRLVNGAYSWDPHADTAFVRQSAIPRLRRAFGCAVLDGKAYLVGGMKEGFGKVTECDVFDLKSKTWSTIPSPARPRVSPNLIAFQGMLWLVGGSSEKADGDGSETNQSVECYDPVRSRWFTEIENLPSRMKEVHLFASGTRLATYTVVPEGGFIELTFIEPRARTAVKTDAR